MSANKIIKVSRIAKKEKSTNEEAKKAFELQNELIIFPKEGLRDFEALVLQRNSKWRVMKGCTLFQKKSVKKVLDNLLDDGEPEEKSSHPKQPPTESVII